jgi:O-antigen ligase
MSGRLSSVARLPVPPSAALRRRAAGFAFVAVLVLGAAFAIGEPRSLQTKLALLGLLFAVLVVPLYRQAAGHLLLVILPFSSLLVDQGVTIFRWATVTLIGTWALAALLAEPVRALAPDRTDVVLALFCGVSVASVLVMGPSSAAPFVGAYCAGLGIYVVVSRCITSIGEARRAITAVCLALSVAGAIALFVPGAAGVREADGLVRIGAIGAAGDPTAGIDRFGGQLVVAVVLAWTALGAWSDRTTLLVRGASVLAFLAFLATYSRAAAVGLGLAIVAWALLYPRGSRLTRSVVGIGLLVAAVAFAPAGLKERFRSLEQGRQEAVSRIAIWRGGVTMFAAHPLVGVGVGNFASELPASLHGDTLSNTHQDAHSVFVASAAEMGVVGLGLVLALFGRLLVESLAWTRRGRREGGSPPEPRVDAGWETEWRRISAGLFVAFVALLAVVGTTDQSRDPFLFAFAGLVHGTYRLRGRVDRA